MTFSFPLVFFWFSFLLYLFRVLSSAFLSSVLQVSEALFALSFSFAHQVVVRDRSTYSSMHFIYEKIFNHGAISVALLELISAWIT